MFLLLTNRKADSGDEIALTLNKNFLFMKLQQAEYYKLQTNFFNVIRVFSLKEILLYHWLFITVRLRPIFREINEEDSEDWEAEMQGELHPRIFTSEWAENPKTPWHVYRFPLPLERIFLIDNARSLRECMRVLCAVKCTFFSWSIVFLP